MVVDADAAMEAAHQRVKTATLQELIEQLLHGKANERANAALALQFLSLNIEKALSIVHNHHAIRALVEVLRGDSDEAREYAAGAFAHLAVNEEAELCLVRSGGVIDSLAAIFIEASTTSPTRLEACTALENLSFSHEGCSAVSRYPKIVETACEMLASGPPKACEKACGLIQNLSVDPDNRIRIASSGGALRGLANLLWTGTQKGMEDAAAAVGNLAATAESRVVGNTDGVMEGLVGVLLKGSDKGKSDAAAALGNLAVNQGLRSCIVGMPQCLEGLCRMLHSNDARQGAEAACCLQNLAVSTNEVKQALAGYGNMLAGLIALMDSPSVPMSGWGEKEPGCQEVRQAQEDACSAVLNLVAGCSENKRSAASAPGLIRAMVHTMGPEATDTAREYAAGLLQNLVFNNAENRELMVRHTEVLVAVSELVNSGPERAAECAAIAAVCLCKAEGGATGLLAVRGMLEGLITCSQSSHAGRRKGGVAALHALSLDANGRYALARNGAAQRALMPAINNTDVTEAGRRAAVQAAMSTCLICAADTSILDEISPRALELLHNVLVASANDEKFEGFKYRPIDALLPLNQCTPSDRHKSRLAAYPSFSQALCRIMRGGQGANRHDVEREVHVDIEACTLAWSLAFDPLLKASLLQAGAADALEEVYSVSHPDVRPLVDGARFQLGLPPCKGCSFQRGAAWSPEEAPKVIVVYDRGDRVQAGKVAACVRSGGGQVWTVDGGIGRGGGGILAFEDALDGADACIVCLSPFSELSPSCRSQLELITSRRGLILPLIMPAPSPHARSYTPRGYFASLNGAVACHQAMLDGGSEAALHTLIKEVRMGRRAVQKQARPVEDKSHPIPPEETGGGWGTAIKGYDARGGGVGAGGGNDGDDDDGGGGGGVRGVIKLQRGGGAERGARQAEEDYIQRQGAKDHGWGSALAGDVGNERGWRGRKGGKEAVDETADDAWGMSGEESARNGKVDDIGISRRGRMDDIGRRERTDDIGRRERMGDVGRRGGEEGMGVGRGETGIGEGFHRDDLISSVLQGLGDGGKAHARLEELCKLVRSQDAVIQKQQTEIEMLRLQLQLNKNGGVGGAGGNSMGGVSRAGREISSRSVSGHGHSIGHRYAGESDLPPEVAISRGLYPEAQSVYSASSGLVHHQYHPSHDATEASQLVETIAKVTDDMLARFESRIEGRMRSMMIESAPGTAGARPGEGALAGTSRPDGGEDGVPPASWDGAGIGVPRSDLARIKSRLADSKFDPFTAPGDMPPYYVPASTKERALRSLDGLM